MMLMRTIITLRKPTVSRTCLGVVLVATVLFTVNPAFSSVRSFNPKS